MDNANDPSVVAAAQAGNASSPRRLGRTSSRFLFESALVVLGVVLGFVVTQWRDAVAERRLAERAVSDVVLEVEANLATIDEQLVKHNRVIEQLASALTDIDSADPAQSGLDFFFSSGGADASGRPLRKAAWEAAVSSGSLRLIDYEVASSLSEIYVAQADMYDALLYQTGLAIFSPDTFDPARRKEVARMLQGLMFEVRGREVLLKEVYERNLPLLRKAAGLASAVTPTDTWLGQWTGPEGTSLLIAGGDGEYRVTLSNLDGPRDFPGHGIGNGIEFQRDDVTEVLRATNGVGTGMKWLTEKQDCLVIRPGEGFCRD